MNCQQIKEAQIGAIKRREQEVKDREAQQLLEKKKIK